MNGVCEKCGLGIHIEMLTHGGSDVARPEWFHDDYKVAWKVDKRGFARNLHFAVPVKHLPGYEGDCPIPGDGITPRSCYRPCRVEQVMGQKCPLGKDPNLTPDKEKKNGENIKENGGSVDLGMGKATRPGKTKRIPGNVHSP